ncbi:MAG: DUF2130 domain-containing protein [Nitrospirae bacterium]|nr:DUF2130 domain-containing protein [Nitrospirota bacterium]
MTEPTVICPKCKHEFKLTESLAAPLLASLRQDYEKRLAQKDEDFTKREGDLRQREEALEKAKHGVDEQVSQKLRQERAKIAAEEAKKAKLALGSDLEQKTKEVEDLQGVLRSKDEKLAEAQKAQADLIRLKREVDEARREAELKVQEGIQAGLAGEREKARKEAEGRLNIKMAEKDEAVASLRKEIEDAQSKLSEAQMAQAEFVRKQRELDDEKRKLDLTVEERLRDGAAGIREQGRKEAEDQLKLKVAEKEQTITSMQKQIEDLKRRAEQGSQQLQGEVQEIELEQLLRAKFPQDDIEPVGKGERGGDIMQRVVGPLGQPCGSILWESKRTKNWSDGWLAKLREDQRSAKAEIAVIVSQVLPKGIDSFDLIDGVWVVHPRAALPVAMALRQTLIEVGLARQASEGQQTKMGMVYEYLTGPRFRQRVQAIVEAFSNMKEDLDKEKKAITKQWAKREEQIDRVMQGTVGLYGDLQGIAGKTLQEIEGLDLPVLNALTPDPGE